jgi:hypothetical protein
MTRSTLCRFAVVATIATTHAQARADTYDPPADLLGEFMVYKHGCIPSPPGSALVAECTRGPNIIMVATDQPQ